MQMAALTIALDVHLRHHSQELQNQTTAQSAPPEQHVSTHRQHWCQSAVHVGTAMPAGVSGRQALTSQLVMPCLVHQHDSWQPSALAMFFPTIVAHPKMYFPTIVAHPKMLLAIAAALASSADQNLRENTDPS